MYSEPQSSAIERLLVQLHVCTDSNFLPLFIALVLFVSFVDLQKVTSTFILSRIDCCCDCVLSEGRPLPPADTKHSCCVVSLSFFRLQL